MFPEQLGYRRAREIIFLDRKMDAKEAVSCGFANGIIDDLGEQDEWFDISKVPIVGQLCNTDSRTLINAKKQFIMAKDLKKIEKVIDQESD